MKLTGYIFKELVLEDRSASYEVGQEVNEFHLKLHWFSLERGNSVQPLPEEFYLAQGPLNLTFFSGEVVDIVSASPEDEMGWYITVDCGNNIFILVYRLAVEPKTGEFIRGVGDLEFEVISLIPNIETHKITGKIIDLIRIVRYPVDNKRPGDVEHVNKLGIWNEGLLLYVTLEIQ